MPRAFATNPGSRSTPDLQVNIHHLVIPRILFALSRLDPNKANIFGIEADSTSRGRLHAPAGHVRF